ncbi:MAG: hypothetical protein HHAS10_11480 [Candidatus Altimarinota bacterium]
MIDTSIFQSRKEKELFLKEVIGKLSISETEKEIYSISLEILEDNDFMVFFEKIISQIENEANLGKNRIAPLTSTLL